MKTIKQLREEYCKLFEQEEVEDKRLTTLVRAGLFDMKKLPILKRALQKDSRAMTPAEKNILLSLLDSVLHQVTSSSQIYNRVKQNVTVTEAKDYYGQYDPRLKTPDTSNIPSVLILRRKALRKYPDNQTIALYYAPSIDKYISIPFDSYISAIGAVNEEEIKKDGFKTGGTIPSSGFRTGGYLEDKPESPKTTAPERTSEPTSKPSDGLDNWRKETEHSKRVDAMFDRLSKKDTSNDPNYERKVRTRDQNNNDDGDMSRFRKAYDAIDKNKSLLDRIRGDSMRFRTTKISSRNVPVNNTNSSDSHFHKSHSGKYRTGGTIPTDLNKSGFRTGPRKIPATSNFRTGGQFEESASIFDRVDSAWDTAEKKKKIKNRVNQGWDTAEKAKPAVTPTPAASIEDRATRARPPTATPIPKPAATAKPATPSREPVNPVRPASTPVPRPAPTAKPVAQTSTPAREPVNPVRPASTPVPRPVATANPADQTKITNRVNQAHDTANQAPQKSKAYNDARNAMSNATKSASQAPQTTKPDPYSAAAIAQKAKEKRGDPNDGKTNAERVQTHIEKNRKNYNNLNAPQRIRSSSLTPSKSERRSASTPDKYINLPTKDSSPWDPEVSREMKLSVAAADREATKNQYGGWSVKNKSPGVEQNLKDREKSGYKNEFMQKVAGQTKDIKTKAVPATVFGLGLLGSIAGSIFSKSNDETGELSKKRDDINNKVDKNAQTHLHGPKEGPKSTDMIKSKQDALARQQETRLKTLAYRRRNVKKPKGTTSPESQSYTEETINLGGNRITINTNIKNKLVEVYDNLSEDRKQKMISMLTESEESYNKVISFIARQ